MKIARVLFPVLFVLGVCAAFGWASWRLWGENAALQGRVAALEKTGAETAAARDRAEGDVARLLRERVEFLNAQAKARAERDAFYARAVRAEAAAQAATSRVARVEADLAAATRRADEAARRADEATRRADALSKTLAAREAEAARTQDPLADVESLDTLLKQTDKALRK